jgi:solute carrier family 35, member E3
MKVVSTPGPTKPAPRFALLLYVAAWFMANGTTVILNKYIFSGLNFRFPLALTLVHMLTQSILAILTIDTFNAVPKVSVDRADYVNKMLVIAAVFCGNICLGNTALRYVPVSFMQTIKSLTPATTAFLQYLLFGSRLTREALLSLIPITAGVALASFTEMSFHAGGFVAAIASCVLTGTKFILSSQMLGGRYNLDSINLLRLMCPPSVVFLLPPVLLLELRGVFAWLAAPERTATHLAILILSGVVSFALNVCLFVVLKATSSVTLTVAGNIKVVLVIIVSVMIFHNPVSPLNAVGCLTAIAGCTWYGLVEKKWQTLGTMEDGKSAQGFTKVSSSEDETAADAARK